MFREGYASKILADVYKIINEGKKLDNQTNDPLVEADEIKQNKEEKENRNDDETEV